MPTVGGSSDILGRVTLAASGLTGIPQGDTCRRRRCRQCVRRRRCGRSRSGRSRDKLGDERHGARSARATAGRSRLRAHTFCHVAPNTWYLMGVVLSAGGAFAWYRDQLARDLLATGDANEGLNAEAATIAPGADGVTFLPYLQGERTPHRDASLRGAFVGLSLAHTRAHLTRAVFEGICFALRDSLSILQALKVAPNRMLLTGGGARSAFVRRMQAEIFGLPVSTVNREEGPAYGAALLAAVGAGAFDDLGAAAVATLERRASETPDASIHAAYDESYRRFRAALHAARA